MAASPALLLTLIQAWRFRKGGCEMLRIVERA